MTTLLPIVATSAHRKGLRPLTSLTVLALASLLGACSTTPVAPKATADSTKSASPSTASKATTTTSPSAIPKPASAPAAVQSSPEQVTVSQGILVHPLPIITPIGGLDDIPQATDPLRPGVDPRKDADPRADLWTRVRSGFGITDLDNDLVRAREQWYAARPDYVDRMTMRGSRYLFHIIEEVERRKMPSELALLPFIESAFNPEALSSAKASGMWQFMPATGKDFALKQNIFRDDRRNVLASTRAALDYLQRLYNQFGDWHLALAAYNWGEGNVQRAINRNRAAGLPTDYSSLRMPLETQHYVPKLQAVKNIVMNPEAFSLRLPPLENHPYFLTVPLDRDIDVELAARLANLSVSEFKALNPQMNKPVILAAGTPQILLPYDNANLFVRNLAAHRGAMASWTAWVAPKTVRTADVAKQWRLSEETLREINRIPPKMLVKAGSTLLIPRQPQSPDRVSEHVADNALIALAPEPPPLRKMVVQVQHKDTLSTVAQRYRVNRTELLEWNKLPEHATLKSGQSLVVFVPQSFRVAKASTARSQRKAVASNTKSQSTRRTAVALNGTSKANSASSKVKVASNR